MSSWPRSRSATTNRAAAAVGDAAHETRDSHHNRSSGTEIATRDNRQWGPYDGSEPYEKHCLLCVAADPLSDDHRLDVPAVVVLPGPGRLTVRPQTRVETVSTTGPVNDTWSFVPALGGYLSGIFIDHPDAWLPRVVG